MTTLSERPAVATLSEEERRRLSDHVRDLTDPVAIRHLIPAVTPEHVEQAARQHAAVYDAMLARIEEQGTPFTANQQADRVKALCEKRYVYLRYAGAAPTKEEARAHLARMTLRLQVATAPLGRRSDFWPTQPVKTLIALVRQVQSCPVKFEAAALEELATTVDDCAAALLEPYMEPFYIQYRDDAQRLESVLARAAFFGPGSAAAALASDRKAALQQLVAKARTSARLRVEDIKARILSGDLAAYVELMDVESMHPGILPIPERDLRQRLCKVLVDAGPERWPHVNGVSPKWPESIDPATALRSL